MRSQATISPGNKFSIVCPSPQQPAVLWCTTQTYKPLKSKNNRTYLTFSPHGYGTALNALRTNVDRFVRAPLLQKTKTTFPLSVLLRKMNIFNLLSTAATAEPFKTRAVRRPGKGTINLLSVRSTWQPVRKF